MLNNFTYLLTSLFVYLLHWVL